jgi:Arc/MetJ family transcription regulator
MASSHAKKCLWLKEIMIMRTTLALDDDLIEKAQALIGPMEKSVWFVKL